MAGQPPPRPGLREALADLLSADGGGPLPEDLADVLWISRLARLEPLLTDTTAPRLAPNDRQNRSDPLPPPPVLEDFTDQPDDTAPDGRQPHTRPGFGQQAGEPQVALHTLTDDGPAEGAGPARLVQVARPSALSEPLALARALRPLRQSVDSTGPPLLDEEATAQATGEARRLLPVWRPAKEPCFSIDLLVDTGATMAVWHRLAVELYTLLERHGAFANVRCWAMNTDTSVPRLVPFHRRPPFDIPAAAPAQHWYRPLEDRTGRRVLLVLTDGVGPAWYATELPAFLTRTSANRPAAALQVLPRRLWHRTALHTAPVEASVADPTRPVPVFRSNATLPGIPKGPRGARDRAAVRWLPVMETKGSWLAPWAELTAGRSSGWTPLLAAPLQGVLRSRRPSRTQEQSAQEQVTRFRSGSSPDAYRLACYLAAAPLSLPVMRLVQRAMMPGSEQTDLAELFLSGLIEHRSGPGPSGDPDDVVYDFRDGVRQELLAELTRGDSLHILERVVAKVSHRVAATFGGVLDFRALAVLTGTGENATSGRRLPEQSLPFAEVAVAVLSGLGGQYRTLARQLAEAAGRGAQGGIPAAEPSPPESAVERRPHDRVRRSVTTGRVGVVFLHGFLSSANVWQPFLRLITQDPELGFVYPLLFEHKSVRRVLGIARHPSFIDQVAAELKVYLEKAAGSFNDLVLVSHSHGGLVVQHYLAQMLTEGRGHELSRIRRIVMFACPNSGEDLFRPGTFGRLFGIQQARQFDTDIARTRHIVLRQVVRAHKTGPDTYPIPLSSYVGESDAVVPLADGTLPDTGVLPGDHFTIVRADSPAHRSYRVLRQQLLAQRAEAGTTAVRATTQPEDPPSVVDGRLPDPVVAMAALPPADGRTLLALYSPNGNVRYWDPLDGALVGGPVRLQAPGTVALASFSGPGGRPCLATVDGWGLTRVWDCADGSPVGRPFTTQSDGVVAMTAFPVDTGGPVLATSGYTGTVCLWDALDGRPRGRFTSTRTFLGRAMTTLPGPQGRGFLATADYTGRVRFWDLRGDRRHRLPGNITLDIRPRKVLAMTAFRSTPNGNLRLATVGYDDVVRLWDLEDTRARIAECAAGPAIPLRNLSLQAAVGWPEAVLTGCEAATAVRRELARTNPVVYEPELATSLHNLSIRYGAAGRTEDALVAEEDASEIRRRLAETDRATYQSDLIRSLHNLSSRYALAGREAEALAVRCEAVALHRRHTSRPAETDASSSEELARSILQLERNVAEMERTRGFDHPDTLALRNALATAYYTAGDLLRTVPLLQENLKAMEHRLGQEHELTRAARGHLAAIADGRDDGTGDSLASDLRPLLGDE
ncbi:SAV_2336 N-terminal domain-related protein [Streptomyces europaeiscabiei]|uniref:SAV_2336 N-terminal domain-related protein n=1 Tax=Streptomyces europaeiscabiei TaxID=146819 RepID=UPI002E29C644|nr:SAV_2336 N-terminal domain-related protein [Streptomyces europaeiscabiei]